MPRVYVSAEAASYLQYCKDDHGLESCDRAITAWFSSLPFERPEFRLFQENTGEQDIDLVLRKMSASHPAAPFKLINAPDINQCFSKGRMIRISRENIDRINKEIEHDKFSDAINFMRDNDVWRSAVVRGFVKNQWMKSSWNNSRVTLRVLKKRELCITLSRNWSMAICLF